MTNSAPCWIGTSWKMNKLLAEAHDFADTLKAADHEVEGGIQRFVIPPFTVLREIASAFTDTSVLVGAQTMHWQDYGAWTGEIAPPMLVDCGANMVELGHSERRRHFAETDEHVGLKVAAAIRHGLIPLICIGETEAERKAGRAAAILENQVGAALRHLQGKALNASILFAYEPVWAIGADGVAASADYAEARHAEIIAAARAILGRAPPCLYGGSVDSDNCCDLIAAPHINGLFIGRAAWDAAGYLAILNRCAAFRAASGVSSSA